MRRTGHHHVWIDDPKTAGARCACGAFVNQEQLNATNMAHANRYSSKQSLEAWTEALDAFAAANATRLGLP